MKMRLSFAAILLSLALYQCLAIHMPPSITAGPEMTDIQPTTRQRKDWHNEYYTRHPNHDRIRHRFYAVDDRISLPCVASADPEPEYVWYRNGVPLFDRERCNRRSYFNTTRDPGTGSIVITEAYSVTEGYYQCRAKNKYGTAMSQVVFLLLVLWEVDPDFDNSEQEYRVAEGQPLKIPCNTGLTLSIPAAYYTWMTTLETSKRITIDEEGNLLFSYVTRGDGDEVYKCDCTNSITHQRTFPVFDRIKVSEGPAPNLPPENMYRTPDVIAIKGMKLELMCFFQGKPEVTISWGRNTSVDLPSHHTVHEFTTRLVINPVALDDEAVYQCNGTNVIGSATQEINVRVKAKPEFERDSDKPRDLNVTEGDTAEFRCSTFAIPDAKVEWFTNGRPLEDVKPGDRYNISEDGRTLTISDVCIDCSNGESDTGNIQCNASNVHGYVYEGIYLRILRRRLTVSPTDTDMKYGDGETVTLKCLATSDESTFVTYEWFLDGEPIDYNDSVISTTDKQHLVIKAETEEVAKKYVGEYTCVASDGNSNASASASVRFPKNPDSGTMTPMASALSAVAGGLLLLILVVVCVFIYLRRRACPWNVVSKSRDMALEAVSSNESGNARLDQLLHSTFDEDMLFKLNKLRIPRACVSLVQQVGKGAFGMVWKAVYHRRENSRIVAAKTVQGSRKIEDVIPILAEALVMGELRHRHVMGLLGVVVDVEPLLVLPFMQNGDLHTYLRSSRFGDSADIKPVEPHQLLVFGRQIAKGMDYLGSKRIVHRDLACRNCMLTTNFVVKVSDFGLSKDVYETNYYRQLKESRLPIKWLAVESLVDRVFSTQSDVWAYGVTLWEVCTKARIPYPSLDNSEVLTYVENGGRMEQPDDCPDQIFSLMTGCWDPDPSKRPTFSELAESIDQYLAEEMGYLDVTGPDDADLDDPDDLSLLYEVDYGDDGNSDDDKGKEDRPPDEDKIVVLDIQTTSV